MTEQRPDTALVGTDLDIHPKVARLMDMAAEQRDALAALGLWALCVAWARRYADPVSRPGEVGVVPHATVVRFCPSAQTAKRLSVMLEDAGLFDAIPGSVAHGLHNFAERQGLADAVLRNPGVMKETVAAAPGDPAAGR